MICLSQCPEGGPCFSPLHFGSWCRSCSRCDPPETAALWWLCEALKVRTAGWGRSSASARGCSECPCAVASSQTPAAGGQQEHKRNQTGLLVCLRYQVRERQPSFRAQNLFERSGWNLCERRSALHTGQMRTCLSLIWPMGCELLWIII